MSILGIFLILLLPYAVGIVFNTIMRQKETSQIETYLIGFFSLFLVQGCVFGLYSFLGVPYENVCRIYSYFSYGLIVLGVILGIFFQRKSIKADIEKMSIRKDEILVFSLAVLAIILVVVRIIMLVKYDRDDIMLETVRINTITSTVNTYNPLTARPYELGIINSKKLIALPLYYSYICMTYKVAPRTLLYLVCELQTVACVLFACINTLRIILKTNKKIYTSTLFVAVMLLSGDYFKGAVGYKILWNGYLGETVIAAVAIPYIIGLMIEIYRIHRGDFGTAKAGKIAVRLLKTMICVAGSVFITGIATGLLLIGLCLAAILVCCTFRFGKEEKA